jgi:hypothetical protein
LRKNIFHPGYGVKLPNKKNKERIMEDYIYTGGQSYNSMEISLDKAKRIRKARRSEKAYWEEIEKIERRQLKLFDDDKIK